MICSTERRRWWRKSGWGVVSLKVCEGLITIARRPTAWSMHLLGDRCPSDRMNRGRGEAVAALDSKGSTSTEVRGLHRASDPRVWGTIVGAIGASVFVLFNRGGLVGPWPDLAVIAWSMALIAYVWYVFLARRDFNEPAPVSRYAGIIYLCSVVGMLALIRVGTTVLLEGGMAVLRPALIVLAVGLHFFPFAVAFRTPMFRVLGSVMVALGSVGLVAGWWWDSRMASASAVVSGVVMLVVVTADAAPSR